MPAFYGYGVAITGIFDERTESIICAFQRHFRPEREDGIVDASTVQTLHQLPADLAA